MPQLFNRHLPVPTGKPGGSGTDYQERELLYKFLFDMKKDLNDLKNMFYELVQRNNLHMPDLSNLRTMPPGLPLSGLQLNDSEPVRETGYYQPQQVESSNRPIIIDQQPRSNNYNQSEEEYAPLAMEEIEKEAIKRALSKYKGRRKEAAEELKISERTLYRKIREYDL
jgi:DNA-binding NtrC family response regulator